MKFDTKDEKSYYKILTFLRRVDKNFPIPLSQKQELEVFSKKLIEKGTICIAADEEELVSMVAGYTDNIVDNIAYISIAATLPEYYGKGLASDLINEFITICKEKKITAVHLYAVHSNLAAVKMYEKLNFVEWKIADDSRPKDLHLIRYL